MEIQKQILLFFSRTHTGFQNYLVQAFTIFAEEYLLIAIALFVYWCISKKKGFITAFSLLTAMNVMGVAKAIVRFPRPWTVIEDLDVVRQNTATGYSFPSGHTTCASSAYTSLAITFKKRWLSILCAVLILLVGLSRMYLCVHWPMDVAGGLLIGCGVSFLMASWLGRLYDDKARSIRVAIMIGIFFCAGMLVFSIFLLLEKIDATAFEDLNITFAMFGGLGFGFAIERSHFDFEIEEGSWGRKIIRYLIGMLGVLIVMIVFKAILKATGTYNPLTRGLRYMLVGLWAGCYPLIGKKLKLFV